MTEIGYKTDYYTEIDSIAKEVMREVAEYGGDTYDLVHRACDGHPWVIYTAEAYAVCTVTVPDWGDYEGDLGAPPSSIEALARWQMMQDVNAAVAELGSEREAARELALEGTCICDR